MVTFATVVRKVAGSNPTLLIATFCEKEFFAKSCSEQGGVRTRDLSHDRDERNHQTERLTSTNLSAHARVSIKLRELFFPGSRPGCDWPFFRSPPAFHRLPFMPPFAGDIGAEPGSLKWIAQIPRKACR